MAEAFLALSGELPGLRTLVVVKRILPHLSANDQFVRMFLDEARIGALLDHPNIPRIIEVGHDEDGYFLAMEAVPGKTLSAILRRAARRKQPLGQADAAFIVGARRRCARIRARAHRRRRPPAEHRSSRRLAGEHPGFVRGRGEGDRLRHRQRARPQERDAGRRPQGQGRVHVARTGRGRAVDRRSDVFSLGIILWEALSGRRLFRRETDLAVMRAISDETIPRPSGPRPIAPRLERIVMTALERAPEYRFQDAHEMAVLLERHAFRTDGFDPAQLVTQIKQLFPADHAGWKATVGTAQMVEDLRARKSPPRFRCSVTRAPARGGRRWRCKEAAERGDDARRDGADVPGGAAADLEIDERPALPRLTGWGTRSRSPGAKAASCRRGSATMRPPTRRCGRGLSGEPGCAGRCGCGCWSGRWPRRACLRACAGGRRAPVTPPTIVDVRDQARAADRGRWSSRFGQSRIRRARRLRRQRAQTALSPSPPSPPRLPPSSRPRRHGAPAPTPESPAASPAAVRPALRRSPPVPARVVKKPVRKPAIAHRAPARRHRSRRSRAQKPVRPGRCSCALEARSVRRRLTGW